MLSLHRFAMWAFRWRTLVRSRRIFEGVTDPYWCETKLFGFRFPLNVARSDTHRLLCLEGERQIGERGLIRGLLGPGMNVVDVGANIGYYLCLLESIVGDQGRVTCIEPSPENLLELRQVIDQNGFRNVTLHDVAIGRSDGSVGLKSGLNSGVVTEGRGAYPVELRALDSLIDGHVDLIKIDVEGFEGEALLGGKNVMQKTSCLFLEVHPMLLPRFGWDVNKVVALVAEQFPKLSCFVQGGESGGPLHRVLSRYVGTDAPSRAAAGLVLAACEAGTMKTPFWIVASR